MIDSLCQYNCLNTLGSYKCTCPTGFSVERGRQCLDINECQTGAHNCSNDDACVNLHGDFRCYTIDCPQGYEKHGNK